MEIYRGKEGQHGYPWHTSLGAGASCLKRLALEVDDSYRDNFKSYCIVDSWFGSVKGVTAACAADNSDREFVVNVKTAHALYPKNFIQNALSGMPGGVHITLTAVHPTTGIKLVACGYKYNIKNTSFFLSTEGAVYD